MKTVLSRALAVVIVAAAAVLGISGGTRAHAKPAAQEAGQVGAAATICCTKSPAPHIGTAVIMIRYEPEWPDVIGTEAAAFIVDGPHVCPPNNEHAGGECAHVRFFTRSPHDGENPDPVRCDLAAECGGHYVKTGMDFRFDVWHDPTGKTPRSWRVWGEAAGDGAAR